MPRAGHAASRGISVGIDVGGTFTDLVAVAPDGAISVRKVPTTPRDQSEGVVRAITDLGVEASLVERIIHGTTVATNMLLERKGARVVLCATAGVTDLLELRRQERAQLYDLTAHHPPLLVPPERVVGVNERIEPNGVVKPLTSEECDRVADAVATLTPDAVAIALLHSYENAAHERMLADALARRLPDVPVVMSSDVLPEIREYERTSTTVAEAYLRRGVGKYVSRLANRVAALALPAPGIMLSSGGMQPATVAAHHAAALGLSGPAGGVIGAAQITRDADIPLALSIDIGGTSADVGLIIEGEPFVESGGQIAGVPIALPRVLVETVSAGGGSIGWIDEGDVLRVGPRSAGMLPGPAAFGRGGTTATVTDAHVVLGNIGATRIGSDITIHPDLARKAVTELAKQLGSSAEQVAEAMIAIADAEMARALRRLSVDRGIDPRRAVLIPFGGGGPLHACGLADRMAITRVLVPPHAGVLSAFGLAISSEQRSAISSIMKRASMLTASTLSEHQRRLTEQLREDGAPADASVTWWVRCRFRGQGHELEVPVRESDDGASIGARFSGRHNARYGFTLDHDVEVVSMRAVAMTGGRAPAGAASQPRNVREPIVGRATVELPDATMLVARGWRAAPHPSGGWMLERES